MTETEINNMAIQTYELGVKMSQTFAKGKSERDYMVLAIVGCIHGLVSKEYSLQIISPTTGEYFKQLRLDKKYTLRQTEDATGISNSYLSQFENGKIMKPSQYVVSTLLNWYEHGISISKSEFDPKGTLKV